MRYDVIKLIMIVVLTGSLWLYVINRPKDPNLAIFSWDKETVLAEGETTREFLNQYHIGRLFQSFSSDLSIAEIQIFRQTLGSDMDVYQLIGTPEWAKDGGADGLIEQAERVIAINQQLAKNEQLKGVVVDVEPYLLDDFDWDDEVIQMSFMANMRKLYHYLTEHNLEMITVVPYFYDTKGYTKVLEFLITDASTELAIMNYYRGDEIEHMLYEAELAKDIGIPVTTIYEFKQPGEYDLTERNTYFNEGLNQALFNLQSVTEAFPNQEIYGAFHDLTALKEVVGYE